MGHRHTSSDRREPAGPPERRRGECGTTRTIASMPDADPSLPDCEFPALRDHLLAHSVQRGDFTLKSGKRSSWFIDAKQTTCSPDGMLLVADALLSVLPDDVTALGGLTVGADAAAYATAGIAATRGRMLKAFTVRKEVKGQTKALEQERDELAEALEAERRERERAGSVTDITDADRGVLVPKRAPQPAVAPTRQPVAPPPTSSTPTPATFGERTGRSGAVGPQPEPTDRGRPVS